MNRSIELNNLVKGYEDNIALIERYGYGGRFLMAKFCVYVEDLREEIALAEWLRDSSRRFKTKEDKADMSEAIDITMGIWELKKEADSKKDDLDDALLSFIPFLNSTKKLKFDEREAHNNYVAAFNRRNKLIEGLS